MKIWFDTLDYDAINDPDFNYANVKALYESIRDGVSVEDACALVMIKPEQYYKWLGYEPFRVLMEQAEAYFRSSLMRKITQASRENPAVALKQLNQLLKAQSNLKQDDIFDELVKMIGVEADE